MYSSDRQVSRITLKMVILCKDGGVELDGRIGTHGAVALEP